MRRVVVLSTGGTIASRPDQRGAGIAADGASALLGRLPGDPGVGVEGADVFRLGSYLLTPSDMWEIAQRVHRVLADPTVLGVVVTHGTDALEESAFLADLVHRDPRPVVFTGAQRNAAAPDTDGPRNLADAIRVAASPAAAGQGALVVFDGLVFAARGIRKSHTLAPAAFSAPDSGAVGWVRDGLVELTAHPVRLPPLDVEELDLDGVRVDIVACYPGADSVALDAVAAAGAQGVVLEATGAGNANHAVRESVARLARAGVVVALSTRVHAGPVAALYGDGGGVDLVEVGAIPTGSLRPSQARVLLLALLARDRDPVRAAADLRRMAGAAPGPGRLAQRAAITAPCTARPGRAPLSARPTERN